MQQSETGEPVQPPASSISFPQRSIFAFDTCLSLLQPRYTISYWSRRSLIKKARWKGADHGRKFAYHTCSMLLPVKTTTCKRRHRVTATDTMVEQTTSLASLSHTQLKHFKFNESLSLHKSKHWTKVIRAQTDVNPRRKSDQWVSIGCLQGRHHRFVCSSQRPRWHMSTVSFKQLNTSWL